MIGHEFPYTNLHDVNIDWILQVVKEFNEKYHGIDDAIDAAIARLNATADELETAMQEYMQGLEEETTANINEIYARFQLEANEAIQAIISNKELALETIDSEMNSKLAQVSTLLNSLPHDYQDALNSMQIINATLNGTNNYPELVQGHYADSQESDSKTLVPDSYRVSSLLSAGCASRKLRTRVTNANGIIRDIIYWTGWGDSAVSHPVPVSTSTSDEKTLFTYTFPADATYFTVVFASDYNMLNAIAPSDLQIDFQWVFNSLETLDIDDETDISGHSDGFILSKDGDDVSQYTNGTEKTHMDVGHTTGTIRHYFKDKQARDDIADLEQLTIIEEEKTTTTDILHTLTWTSGYMGVNGSISPSNTLQYSSEISVSAGDILTILPTTTAFRYICAFNDNIAVADKGAQNVNTYTVPDGVDTIVVTVYLPTSSYAPTAINDTATRIEKKNINADNIAELNTEVSAMEEAITVEEYMDEEESNIAPVFSNGYMNTAGLVNAEGSAAYFDHTQKISVQPGDVVTVWRDTNSYSMRFVCAFSGDSPVQSSGSSDEVTQFTVPDGIDGVVVSVRDSNNINNIRVTHTEAKETAYVKPNSMGYMMEQGSLSSGMKMTLPFHNVKNHNIYVFNANIQTFNKIKFSKGASTYIEVDATNIVIVNDLNTFTIPHGLTIANNITIMVCNETSTSISLVRISSNGQEFNYTTATRFIMDNRAPEIESTGSTLTECAFSWVSKNLNAPIWLFGDSYFSWYENRWTYYLARDGYTKDCMLNGYAGEASADAYTALKNLLEVTTPKIVVWCMGMNDGDSQSAVNANWMAYYEKLINLSKKYGFEIVLYTVPTTPAISNKYKDTIIRNSGYRYIEADLAVRIDENGNWIPGALDEGTVENPDNVHPTPMGAKIIYYRVISDLPEILCNY